jgi:hypothetical protein
MSSLPGQLDFAATEEEICQEWKTAETFATQNRLALERGDEVRLNLGINVCGNFTLKVWHRSHVLFASTSCRLLYALELIDIEIYIL